MRLLSARLMLVALAQFALAQFAAGQPAPVLPDRPIRMIMTGAAGGGTDAPSRLIASKLAEALGRTVVVEPLPSGGGVVAVQTVSRARPDGMTMLSATSALVTVPRIDPSVPYNAFRDLVPVSQLNAGANILVVGRQVPAANVEEFLALVRASPDRYEMGNYGHGSTSHLYAELFNRRAGLALTHVPIRAGLLTALLGGHVCCAFIDTSSASSQLRTGNLRILAASGPARLAALPEVPTFGELGYPGFEPRIWQGFFLPAGTPREIVQMFGRAIHAAVRTEEVAGRIRAWGFEPVGSLPDEFAESMRREDAALGAIIEQTGIRAP